MNKKNFKALLLAAVVTLFACNNKNGKESKAADTANNMGLYSATLPCGSCPGINTLLTLNSDSTAYLTRMYLDSDNTSETVDGKWTFADSIFTVKTTDGETQMYKLVSENELAQVGATKDVQNVKKEYILKKTAEMLADKFAGKYTYGSDEKGAYAQTLTITKISDKKVNVAISQTGGAGKGCEFKGEGKIVNNQIEVNMKDVNPDMKSVMTIRPTDNDGKTLNVFTSSFEDRYDLMFFCGGGGSLAGDYTKK